VHSQNELVRQLWSVRPQSGNRVINFHSLIPYLRLGTTEIWPVKYARLCCRAKFSTHVHSMTYSFLCVYMGSTSHSLNDNQSSMHPFPLRNYISNTTLVRISRNRIKNALKARGVIARSEREKESSGGIRKGGQIHTTRNS
jgi:hypothetical protein